MLGFGKVSDALRSGHLSVNSDAVSEMQTIVLGALLQVIANAIQSSAPPFPVFVLAYFMYGFGQVIQVCHLFKLGDYPCYSIKE